MGNGSQKIAKVNSDRSILQKLMNLIVILTDIQKKKCKRS